MTTELVANDANPIYLSQFTFSSANFLQIEFKVEIFASKNGRIATDNNSAKLLGEQEFVI